MASCFPPIASGPKSSTACPARKLGLTKLLAATVLTPGANLKLTIKRMAAISNPSSFSAAATFVRDAIVAAQAVATIPAFTSLTLTRSINANVFPPGLGYGITTPIGNDGAASLSFSSNRNDRYYVVATVAQACAGGTINVDMYVLQLQVELVETGPLTEKLAVGCALDQLPTTDGASAR